MKSCLTVLIVAVSWGATAQSIFAPMRDAIKNGNASELVKYFNSTVDLTLEGEVNTYSKAQAEFVLRDFFKKHTPSDFTIVHSGASKAGLQFAIGKFKSGNDSYDVLMRVREVDKMYLIHEMSFTR
ncbi:MAG: DUF4783 domain-containing protein [Bacteroidetes bacterium]|nr:DUF4783 domain-containing protein [Bacteroidota bacterium]MBS1540651.1 DUF4783 domain-containing protein [Bacteroidota bacterium]